MTTTGVRFELTADAHARKVYHYEAFIGTLLFHDGEFKLDLGPSIPFPLKLASSIMTEAMEDKSIQYQKDEDHKIFLASNARHALGEMGIDASQMTDQKAVETYLTAPNTVVAEQV